MNKTLRNSLAAGRVLLKGAARAGLGALASRERAALVPGVSRARPVAHEETFPAAVDVVVIGGGNIGCLTALTLAERGVRVALCEKGVIAGEASGRSLGYVDGQFLDPVKMEMIGRSKALWATMHTRVGADVGYRGTGLATCFSSAAALDGLQGWIEAVRGLPGVDARVLTAAELDRLLPDTQGRFAVALYQSTDATVEPTLAAPAIADAVRRHGGRVLQQCAVRGIETAAGRVCGVVTERGRIACSSVVLAGGVWSPLMARTLGLDLPQFMAFGSVARLADTPGTDLSVIAADQGAVMRRNLVGGHDVCKGVGIAPVTPALLRHLPRLGPALDHMGDQLMPVFNLATFLTAWRMPRRWALDAPSPFEAHRILTPAVHRPLLDDTVRDIGAALPALRGARVTERWAGALMSTPDNMPILGAADGVPGLFLGTGFYFGLTMAPAAGEALADLVMGRRPSIHLSLYRPSRFHDGSELVFRA